MRIRLKEWDKMEGRFQGDAGYWSAMQKVAGQWLKVETEYLFQDQFNTEPKFNVTRCGLRVNECNVAEVEDDERPDAGCCERCNRVKLKAISTRQLGSLCLECGGQIVPFVNAGPRLGTKGFITRYKSVPCVPGVKYGYPNL